MIIAVLVLWVIAALLILWEQRIARIIIYLGVFSLVSALSYLLFGSPDVAMAEAATSAFSTIFFIICFEKYFRRGNVKIEDDAPTDRASWPVVAGGLVFVLILFGLVIYTTPEITNIRPLMEGYLTNFFDDIGGQNAVTAVYLGYRIYDTLFEALMVVISVVAVVHMSAFREKTVSDGEHSEIENSRMAVFAIQIICPVMLMYGVYLILNGHLTPGGGFQGGLAAAAFFICRYMIYDVYDLPIGKLAKLEEMVFIGIVIFAISVVFLGAASFAPIAYQPVLQNIYLLLINALIGLKVACGFIILFYRYIAIEGKLN